MHKMESNLNHYTDFQVMYIITATYTAGVLFLQIVLFMMCGLIHIAYTRERYTMYLLNVNVND